MASRLSKPGDRWARTVNCLSKPVDWLAGISVWRSQPSDWLATAVDWQVTFADWLVESPVRQTSQQTGSIYLSGCQSRLIIAPIALFLGVVLSLIGRHFSIPDDFVGVRANPAGKGPSVPSASDQSDH